MLVFHKDQKSKLNLLIDLEGQRKLGFFCMNLLSACFLLDFEICVDLLPEKDNRIRKTEKDNKNDQNNGITLEWWMSQYTGTP